MLQKTANLLRGNVRLEVTGVFPERFLNLCAQRTLSFWDVEWPEPHVLRLTVAWSGRKGLDELAAKTGCTIKRLASGGLPGFLARFRKRYALLLGLALALAAVCVLSRFVLVVEVTGGQNVPTQTVLTELYRLGLRPGVYGPGVDTRTISNEALLRLDGLSWLTVNIHGIRAEVVVRDKVEKPEILDKTVLGDIVADAPGLVTKLEVFSGDPAVEVGATVLPGDVLIRGSVRLDPPQYSEYPTEWMPVRAMGRVEARTWRTLTAEIPLEAGVKAYTGEEQTRYSCAIFGRRVNFYRNSGIPFDEYDKIDDTWNLTLPGGTVLPFALRRETLRAYDLAPAPLDRTACAAMLEERLSRELAALLGEAGRVVTQSFTARERDGTLRVTLSAECAEELGRFVPAG